MIRLILLSFLTISSSFGDEFCDKGEITYIQDFIGLEFSEMSLEKASSTGELAIINSKNIIILPKAKEFEKYNIGDDAIAFSSSELGVTSMEYSFIDFKRRIFQKMNIDTNLVNEKSIMTNFIKKTELNSDGCISDNLDFVSKAWGEFSGFSLVGRMPDQYRIFEDYSIFYNSKRKTLFVVYFIDNERYVINSYKDRGVGLSRILEIALAYSEVMMIKGSVIKGS